MEITPPFSSSVLSLVWVHNYRGDVWWVRRFIICGYFSICIISPLFLPLCLFLSCCESWRPGFFCLLALNRKQHRDWLTTAQDRYTEKDWGRLSPTAINLPIEMTDDNQTVLRLGIGHTKIQVLTPAVRNGTSEGFVRCKGMVEEPQHFACIEASGCVRLTLYSHRDQRDQWICCLGTSVNGW